MAQEQCQRGQRGVRRAGSAAAGQVAVRDSKNPDGATLVFARAEFRAWLRGAQAGEFDDLA